MSLSSKFLAHGPYAGHAPKTRLPGSLDSRHQGLCPLEPAPRGTHEHFASQTLRSWEGLRSCSGVLTYKLNKYIEQKIIIGTN